MIRRGAARMLERRRALLRESRWLGRATLALLLLNVALLVAVMLSRDPP
jgi:hypothetical protein